MQKKHSAVLVKALSYVNCAKFVRVCMRMHVFVCLCYSHTVANILANVNKIIFAASGEYMANGLTNAIRHQLATIAN